MGTALGYGKVKSWRWLLRGAMKRLMDAYTWGALGEADYREKLRELRDQLERVNAARRRDHDGSRR